MNTLDRQKGLNDLNVLVVLVVLDVTECLRCLNRLNCLTCLTLLARPGVTINLSFSCSLAAPDPLPPRRNARVSGATTVTTHVSSTSITYARKHPGNQHRVLVVVDRHAKPRGNTLTSYSPQRHILPATGHPAQSTPDLDEARSALQHSTLAALAEQWPPGCGD